MDNSSQVTTDAPSARNWWARHEPAIAFLLGVVAMTYIQSATYEPAGRDGFYHIKMAVLLPEIGFPEHFHWLRHTILNQQNVSHHHGFHIMMVPFVFGSEWLSRQVPDWFRNWAASESSRRSVEDFKIGLRSWLESPYILGGKVLNAILFGLITLFFDLVLRRANVGVRWFWLLAFLGLPTDFFLRMSYVRAPTASLLILLGVLHFAFARRFVWVGILGAVYCHVYGGFVFYPIVIAAVMFSLVLTAGRRGDALWILISSILGTAIGLLTHPYFPQNIKFFEVQLFETGLQTAEREHVNIGSEWRPFNILYWLQISSFTLYVFVASISLRFSLARLRHPVALTTLVLNGIFLVLCLWKRRFIEYWPVFCLLSSAVFWIGFDDDWRARSPFIYNRLALDWPMLRGTFRKAGKLLALATLGIGIFTLHASREAAKCKFNIPEIKRAMSFLRGNTPPGSLVFADDWDEFPMHFYYNHHNDYVCGLDPQFTNSMDPWLWERFCVITQGRAPRRSTIRGSQISIVLDDIRTYFAADYVLINDDHPALYKQVTARPDLFTLVYPVKSSKFLSAQPKIAIFSVARPAAPASGG